MEFQASTRVLGNTLYTCGKIHARHNAGRQAGSPNAIIPFKLSRIIGRPSIHTRKAPARAFTTVGRDKDEFKKPLRGGKKRGGSFGLKGYCYCSPLRNDFVSSLSVFSTLALSRSLFQRSVQRVFFQLMNRRYLSLPIGLGSFATVGSELRSSIDGFGNYFHIFE